MMTTLMITNLLCMRNGEGFSRNLRFEHVPRSHHPVKFSGQELQLFQLFRSTHVVHVIKR